MRRTLTAYPGVRVAESATGRGVFVRRAVRAGDPILEFRGEAIDFAATLRKGDRECDAMQIGPDLYLDLDAPGRFVNHSCDPNAGLRDAGRLVAMRDLKRGDEVRFDYSTTMSEDHWTMECHCTSPACRGTIRDFRWLPHERKLELIRQGFVLPFLVAEEIDAGRITTEQIEAGLVSGKGAA
ncbi:SET domain-containing protein-lysine N-methyltransferase [bacterium]|nr:SET domain-containing protein-lysine N-methyltransferase [bacterium]